MIEFKNPTKSMFTNCNWILYQYKQCYDMLDGKRKKG